MVNRQLNAERRFFEPSAPKKRPNARIVGGNEARPHSYPWMTSLQHAFGRKPEDTTDICGGALVRSSDKVDASDIVVTAAHCIDLDPTHVKLGTHSMSMPSDGEQVLRVSKAIKHASYLGDKKTLPYDIAILKLEKPVNFTKTIQPACLPAAGEKIADGAPGIVTGWGLLQENGDDYPDLLQQAVLPAYNTEQCLEDNQSVKANFDAKLQFCAGYSEGGIDSCTEDSGGPWVLKNPGGRYVLQGVVSFGIGCGRVKRPGVYARVAGHIPWLNEQIKTYSSVKQ